MTTRRIPFPLRNPVQIEGTSAYDVPSFFDLDAWVSDNPDTEIDIVMRLSLNQYNQIASMTDVARDLIYPEISESIWMMFVTRIQSMTICDSVANCIDNSDIVKQAIENYLVNNSNVVNNINTRIENLEDAVLQPIPTLANCDDVRWAGIVATIALLNTNSIDFLETLADNLQDTFERVVNLITAVPLIGDGIELTGIDGVLNFIADTAGDALDEYENADTVPLKDAIACDIFCNTEGCEITIDDLIIAYQNLLPQSVLDFGIDTFADIFSYILDGSLATDNYYALVNLIQLYALKLRSVFFGTELNRLMIEYAIATQTPSNGHTLLCDCPVPCALPYLVDFDSTNECITNLVYNGTIYDIGAPYFNVARVTTATSGATVNQTITFDTPSSTANRIALDIFAPAGEGGFSPKVRAYFLTSSGYLESGQGEVVVPAGAWASLVFTTSFGGAVLGVKVVATRFNSNSTPINLYLDNIELYED